MMTSSNLKAGNRRGVVLGESNTLAVASQFSRVPGGRFIKKGPFSGELFRKDFLVPSLRKVQSEHGKLIVQMDGTAGYPASFLDEAFAGLIRDEGFTLSELNDILVLQATAQRYQVLRDLAWSYMREADTEAK